MYCITALPISAVPLHHCHLYHQPVADSVANPTASSIPILSYFDVANCSMDEIKYRAVFIASFNATNIESERQFCKYNHCFQQQRQFHFHKEDNT